MTTPTDLEKLREEIARALYEHFVGDDFLNEYAPWPELGDKQTWFERADVVLSIPTIADRLAS